MRFFTGLPSARGGLLAGLLLLLCSYRAQAQTDLQPGELVITGLNTSPSAEDWVFAPLVDLAVGTQIKFTDNGWHTGSGFRLTEGVAVYTVPAGGMPKGRLVSFRRNRADFQVSGTLAFEPNGDQLFAYQGSEAQPAFIMALTTKGNWQDGYTAGTSELPPALAEGKEALTLTWDNAFMDEMRRRKGTEGKLQEWFNTATNWTGNDQQAVVLPTTDLDVEEGMVPDADELQALLDLYNRTNGRRWARQLGWPGNPLSMTPGQTPFLGWEGVTVVGGDITALQLPNNNLLGQLPVSLGRLTALQTLELPFNQVQGTVPDSLRHAQGLLRLALNDNQLTGDLPALLADLPNLSELALGHNRFSGPLAPAMLRRWGHLTLLELDNNQLTGLLPNAVGSLRAVQSLDLSNNRLRGSLPDSLSQLARLEHAYLADNQFAGEVPAAWGTLPRLRTLYLGNNRLSGALPGTLANLARLRRFDVTGNQLSGTIPLLAGDSLAGIFGFGSNRFSSMASYRGLGNPASIYLDVRGNELDFVAIEANLTGSGSGPGQHSFGSFRYDNQRPPTPADTVSYLRGASLQARRARPGQYTDQGQWEREAVAGSNLWVDVPGSIGMWLYLPNAQTAHQGLYRLRLTNSQVPGLTLYSRAVYADLVPYGALPENRPVDASAPPALASSFAPASRVGAADSLNYRRTYAPRQALTDPARVVRAGRDSVQVTTEYYDGLGRLAQTVQHRASPAGRDLVLPVAYDALGRQPRQYLPYAASSAPDADGYRPDALAEQYAFYHDQPIGPGFASAGVARTGVPFAETGFEPSPLNRVLAQAAPGETWQMASGHATGQAERPNAAADSVQYFTTGYGANANALAAQPGGYAPGELWGTQTTDEHRFRTLAWQDKSGQTVLRQVEAACVRQVLPDGSKRWYSRWLRTYYVYDDFGRRRAVLPPEAVKEMQRNAWAVTPAAEKLLFRYRYDGRGRVVAKQVPGTDGETWLVYNQLDQPVLTQDAAQRGRGAWAFAKYDALGRPVLTGLVNRAGVPAPEALQAEADATAIQDEQRTADVAAYPHAHTTDRAYPRLGQQGFDAGQVLSATHYDDYNFDNDAANTPDAAYAPDLDAQLSAPPVPDARTTGLVTRTRTRVLGVPAADPAAWLTATTFYDARARPVQVQSTNARGGLDLATSQLDFTGQVLKTVTRHRGPNLPAAGLTLAETRTYDPAGRLLATSQQLPNEGQPAPVAALAYNELGQLTRKTLGTGALRQNVDYTYNVRGWLTHLNDPGLADPADLFGLELAYEQGFTPGYEQFNGNITGQKWRSRRDGTERAYGYAYDPLNRLRQGDYVARAGTSAAAPWTAEAGNHRLYGVSYDDNGNLLTLRRRGLLANATRTAPARFGPVDMLSYRYDGNRLLAVDDLVSTNQLPRPAGYNGAPASLAGDFQEQGTRQATEYFYDANGSLTQDRNKGISAIAYNHLNLPTRIAFGQGADSLVFRYSAAGQKVAKLVYQTGKPTRRTDYLGPYQYEADTLRFFPHAEGRVLYTATGLSGPRYAREFTLKDHLGNLRLAYRAGSRRTFAAGLEPADAARESQWFDSLSVSPPVAFAAGTLARTGQYVARLNAGGTAPQPLGPLAQLAVQKGDTVTVTAPGLYPRPVRVSSFAFSLASFVAGLLGPAPAPPPGTDGGRPRPWPLLSLGLSAGLPALAQVPSGVPKGYLRLLVFDRDSTLLSSQTRQLSAAAFNNYEPLTASVVVPRDGYVTAYVGNESNADVYFDDVTITHGQGLQIQETEYDPTGLELAGLGTTSPGLRRLNQYQWNGKEFQTDLGLNWTSLDWRMVDPQLGGGFHVVDPEVENGQESMSPYAFGYDNALRFNDPNGRNPGDPIAFLPAIPFAFAVAELIVDALVTAGIVGTSAAIVYEASKIKVEGGSVGAPAFSGDSFIPLSAQYARNQVVRAQAQSANTANGRVNASSKTSNSNTQGSNAGSNKASNSNANGNIPAPGKGKGSVPPSQRDPKRVMTKSEKTEMLAARGGACEGCNSTLNVDNAKAHHVVRHADGGATAKSNTAILCADCHQKIHK